MSFRHKITVCLTIDEDGDAGFRDAGTTDRTTLSRAAYGPNVGLPRILALLKQHDLQATCFIPGETLERFPEACKKVRDAGHEIGHHGYTHRSPSALTLEEEQRDFERGCETLHKVLGITPKGYRAPWLHLSENTHRIVAEHNFRYDASECGQETPFCFEVGGKKLLEIPSKYELIDTPLFLNFAVPGFPPFPVDPEAIEKIWKAEFTGMYKAEEELCYVHVIHPFCIGHFSRFQVYKNLIEFILNHSGVTFSTLSGLLKKIR